MTETQKSTKWPKAGLVGYGDYVLPGVTDVKVGRELFFAAMRKVARPALDDFYSLISLYSPLEERLWANEHALQRRDWTSWAAWKLLAAEDENVAMLVGRLEDWANRYHLIEPWLLDSMTRNLVGWSQIPRCAENREWLYPGSAILVGDGRFGASGIGLPEVKTDFRAFKPDVPAPNPLAQTRQDYLDKVLHIAEEAWNKAVQEVEAVGGQPAVIKRNRGGGSLLHFEWLALYQVMGVGYADIADLYSSEAPSGDRVIDIDTVRKAVISTARLVGTTLRV